MDARGRHMTRNAEGNTRAAEPEWVFEGRQNRALEGGIGRNREFAAQLSTRTKAIPSNLSVEMNRLMFELSSGSRKHVNFEDHRFLRMLFWDASPKQNLAEVRMELLIAVGNCHGLETVDIGSAYDRVGYFFTMSEMKSLLKSLRSNSSLRTFGFSLKNAESTSVCCWLAKFLARSKSLEVLTISSPQCENLEALSEISGAFSTMGTKSCFRHLRFLSKDRVIDDKDAVHLATMINAIPDLQELTLEVKINESAARKLGRVMAGREGLKKLTLVCARKRCLEIAKLIEATFSEGARNLEHLELIYSGAYDDDVDHKDLRLKKQFMAISRQIPFLHGSPNLRVLKFPVHVNPESDQAHTFVELIHPPSKLEELVLTFDTDSVSLEEFFKTLASNHTIIDVTLDFRTSSLSQRQFSLEPIQYEYVADFLGSSTALESLGLWGWTRSDPNDGDVSSWSKIFAALRTNSRLRRLDLLDSKGLDENAFKELMGVLQLNSTLEEIVLEGTEWDTEEKAAIVTEELNRKARKQSYLALLREGFPHSSSSRPTGGLLLMFGSSHSGKTELCNSMIPAGERGRIATYYGLIDTFKRKIRSLKCLGFNRRIDTSTGGIEIRMLKIEPKLQLSVWDLGGEDIYRPLLEYLFPKLNRACLFAFVFSVFDHKRNEVYPISRLEETFRTEFRSWLRFLSSNLDVRGENLPRVIVIFSHNDKMSSKTKISEVWEGPAIASLRKDFEKLVEISPKVYSIDARSRADSLAILEWVEKGFHELFDKVLARAPQVCCDVNLFITRWAMENSKEPVVDFASFVSLCEVAHPDLKNLESGQHEKVMSAIACYLHDLGTIIDLNLRQHLVVMNPNWLTNVFLGRLLWMGHGFQQSDEDTIEWISLTENTQNGFITAAGLNKLLETRFLKPLQKEKYIGLVLRLEVLLNILSSLHLCLEMSSASPSSDMEVSSALDVEVTGTSDVEVSSTSDMEVSSTSDVQVSRTSDVEVSSDFDAHGNAPTTTLFFLPGLLEMKQASPAMGKRKLKWLTEESPQDSYFGVRIRCKDTRHTYLSSGFFPRLQVFLCRKMGRNSKLKNHQFVCELNLISFTFNGDDVLVENDGEGDHIDVLVKSRKPREVSWDFVSKHFVEEIQAFCATSRGCPGVELVLEALRTDCVRRLTFSAYRRENQAISMTELRERLQQSIRNGGGQLVGREGGLYVHKWLQVRDNRVEPPIIMGASRENATDLLAPSDLVSVREWVEAEKNSLAEKAKKVKRVTKEMWRHQNNFPTMGRLKGSPTETITDTRFLARKQDELNTDSDDLKRVMDPNLAELDDEIKEFDQTHDRLRKYVNAMSEKLDDLIGFSQPSADTEMPRRPYFNSGDERSSHQISAFLRIGKPVLLHFLCEAGNQGHIVTDQLGFPITVTKHNSKLLRSLTLTSAKALWYLFKAGAQLTPSIENAIPALELFSSGHYTQFTSIDLSASGSDSLLIDGVESDSSSRSSISDAWKEEAWRWLQDHLKRNVEGDTGNFFGLTKVRYPARNAESTSAHVHSWLWLCRECLEEES